LQDLCRVHSPAVLRCWDGLPRDCRKYLEVECETQVYRNLQQRGRMRNKYRSNHPAGCTSSTWLLFGHLLTVMLDYGAVIPFPCYVSCMTAFQPPADLGMRRKTHTDGISVRRSQCTHEQLMFFQIEFIGAFWSQPTSIVLFYLVVTLGTERGISGTWLMMSCFSRRS
jgi:hypothetical protein